MLIFYDFSMTFVVFHDFPGPLVNMDNSHIHLRVRSVVQIATNDITICTNFAITSSHVTQKLDQT